MADARTTSALEALRRRLTTGGNSNRIAFTSTQIEGLIERFNLPAALRTRAFQIPAYASRRASAFVTPAVEPEDKDRQFTFVISDPGIDRSNDTIAITGWQLSNYSKNAIVLWSHAGLMHPIGRSVRVWVQDNQLRATVQIAPASANPDAENVLQLIRGGYLKAASVGFVPIEFKLSDKPDRKYGIDFTQQELLEWSIVGIPANPFCTIVLPAAGKKLMDGQPERDEADAESRLARELAKRGKIIMDQDRVRAIERAAKRKRLADQRAREIAIRRARGQSHEPY